ncbi:IS66 family transposase [Consotaella aegiceratis]|uniref:IS66 family transposase n=2 Tax=Consotaella aegiceratis TaxID=3097961 RepID=UPI002F41F153
MERSDLQRLSKDELIDLVLRLQRPGKTSRTSSKPPSTDRKERRERSKPGGAKPGHEGKARVMSDRFDRLFEHRPCECPCCRAALSEALSAETASEHETVDLAEAHPIVERHRRLSVVCPACGARVTAPMPGTVKGTPFGPRLHAVATYLKTFQGLSYERLQRALADLFGLSISQGGLMNMLRRAQTSFVPGRDDAIAALRQARVVASDETGVRIEGSNAYQWVFRSADAVVHRAAMTRGAIVIGETMDGHRPKVWCSDRYSAQQGHADAGQACLAHLARDVAYAEEASEHDLPFRLRLWLNRAFALAGTITTMAASTIAAKRRALERSLDDILAASTNCPFARDIQHKFRRARNQLLTFADWPGALEATNNACERALRPAVIQRKVTNGYRALWAAQGEADIRTVVDTARLRNGANPFQTIRHTLSA